MKIIIEDIPTPYGMGNWVENRKTFNFGLELNEQSYLEAILINDQRLPFLDTKGLYWIRKMYISFIEERSRKFKMDDGEMKAVHKPFHDRLLGLYRIARVPKEIQIWKNIAEPYNCLCIDDRYNLPVEVSTILDLAREFVSIRNCEDRFCTHCENNKMLFYYSWKE
jgi:hypothetical protein